MAGKGTPCRFLVVVLPILLAFYISRERWNLLLELENLYASSPPVWNANVSYVPKVNLQHIEECTKDTKFVRVCVVRNAVNSSALEAFLRMNEDAALSLLRVNSSIASLGSFARGGSIDVSGSSLTNNDRVLHATVGELARGETGHAYRGFASFNFSSYAPLLTPILEQGLFEGQGFPDRADIFAGNVPAIVSTAALHANQLEKSSSVQVLGEKIWNHVTPECMFREMKAYRIGMFIAPADTGMEVLERCVVTTAITRPGDVLIFPKRWPHQLYTLPGPNMMITLRIDTGDVKNPGDLYSVLTHAMFPDTDGSNKICNPNVELVPTGFNHGAPKAKTRVAQARDQKSFYVDLRHCMLGRLPRLDQYIQKKQSFVVSDAAEASLLKQIVSFHGRPELFKQ